MNNYKNNEQLRTIVIEKILNCIDDRAPQENIPQIAQIFQKKADLHNDIPLLESAALVDFLAQQIDNGNRDLVTQEIVVESYKYILDKLIVN